MTTPRGNGGGSDFPSAADRAAARYNELRKRFLEVAIEEKAAKEAALPYERTFRESDDAEFEVGRQAGIRRDEAKELADEVFDEIRLLAMRDSLRYFVAVCALLCMTFTLLHELPAIVNDKAPFAMFTHVTLLVFVTYFADVKFDQRYLGRFWIPLGVVVLSYVYDYLATIDGVSAPRPRLLVYPEVLAGFLNMGANVFAYATILMSAFVAMRLPLQRIMTLETSAANRIRFNDFLKIAG